MKRTALAVAVVGVLVALVLLLLWQSQPSGPTVVIGTVADYPVGSITQLDLRVKLTEHVPRVSDSADLEIAEVPIFLVNDSAAGLLALYAMDPHLGCRVLLVSDLPPDSGFDPAPEVVFLTPCHGEQYDLLGRYIAGPAPRGLDRFGVSVVGEDVVVDVAAFEYGPGR